MPLVIDIISCITWAMKERDRVKINMKIEIIKLRVKHTFGFVGLKLMSIWSLNFNAY